MQTKNELSQYLENVSLFLLGLLLLTLPITFTNLATDTFALPKQALFVGITFIVLLLSGVKMISDKAVRLRRTPYDLPMVLFTAAILLSSFFSLNRYDSLIAVVPLVCVVLSYFLIVQTTRTEGAVLFLQSALVAGATLIAIQSITSLLKIYPLPLSYTHVQTFSPFGSLLEEAVFLAVSLAIAVQIAMQALNNKQQAKSNLVYLFSTISFILGVGLCVSIYKLMYLENPVILPLETGFQTAFAAISQDTGRVVQGFLSGSGYGTYFSDFTRFKSPAFNLNQNLWSLFFFRSSSFVLELLGTTGVLGVGAFIFLIIKIIKSLQELGSRGNSVVVSVFLLLIASFVLPFSFTLQAILFLSIALFATIQGLRHPSAFFDVELHLIASKRNPALPWLPMLPSSFSKFLPITVFLVSLAAVLYVGFFAGRFVLSDVLLKNSFDALAANNGLSAYNNQTNSIQIFPYRDLSYRVYSQTNLAVANAIVSSQPKGATLSAQTQQTVLGLIQQSINSARSASTISPVTSVNWDNLSSIYRSLIGFGQNAEQFAVVINQQAILLDPNNPQEYLTLGGLYFQLNQLDNAERQFQIAVNLKPDYANAYYNLGHTLEKKGDIKGALSQYEIVKNLTAQGNDKENLKKITAEIEALQKNAEGAAAGGAQTTPPSNAASQGQQQLGISESQTQLPQQNPPVKIPPPPSITPTPTK